MTEGASCVEVDVDRTIEHWRAVGVTVRHVTAQIGAHPPTWARVRERMVEIEVTGVQPSGVVRRRGPRRARVFVPRRRRAVLAITRRARGLTIPELAVRLEVSENALSKYERGVARPTSDFLAAWRAELGLTTMFSYGGRI